jgi:hypothetical protein
MANTWGNDNTGHDKKLYEIGTTLQNIQSLETLQIAIAKLERICDQMEKERSIETLKKLGVKI